MAEIQVALLNILLTGMLVWASDNTDYKFAGTDPDPLTTQVKFTDGEDLCIKQWHNKKMADEHGRKPGQLGGVYLHETNTIWIAENLTDRYLLMEQLLFHELVHAMQYKADKAGYVLLPQQRACLEFEAYLLADEYMLAKYQYVPGKYGRYIAMLEEDCNTNG